VVDRRFVLAVDGGNSKTDVALVAESGRLRAAVRGPTVSHQAVGLKEGMARLAALAGRAGVSPASPADVGVFALAGADFASDVRTLEHGIGGLGVAREVVVVNDTMAALRAGSRRPWGVALICGQGVNGAGVAPDGRVARFDGVGDISGDWGGGGSLGVAAQAASVRARDGRGPRTSLERLVPAHFGLASPGAVVRALYRGRIEHERLGELSPVVFEAAVDGDAVAREIVDRLADELGVMAAALIRRLRLGRLDPDVVLAGGVFRAEDPAFHERLAALVTAAAPAARIIRLEAPPVLGSALLALERLGRGPLPEAAISELDSALRGLASSPGGTTPDAGRATVSRPGLPETRKQPSRDPERR
jgi:N-acetylglucosamine kinase-like BadF-type ATPase